MRKHAVGLVVLTDLPDGQRVAVLQVRGTFNPEKMAPESYPGACQVTCHGGAKHKEDELGTLWREAAEELGVPAATMLRQHQKGMREISRLSTTDKEVATYSLLAPDCSFLKELQLGPATGGIRLVDATTPIANLLDWRKDEGVIDRRTVAMFPDERDAVKKAFEIFST